MYKLVVMSKKANDGEFWADKFMDLANISLAVLVFSQFEPKGIHWNVIFLGSIIYLSLVGLSFFLKGLKQ